MKKDLVKGLLYGFFVTGVYVGFSLAVYTTMWCQLGESPVLDICFSFLGNDHPVTIFIKAALIIPLLLGLGVFVYALKTKRVIPSIRVGMIVLLTFFLLSVFLLSISITFYGQPGISYGQWAFAGFLVIPGGWLDIVGAVALYAGMVTLVIGFAFMGKFVGTRM